MYVILLQFDVREGQADTFVRHWTATTRYIYEHFGSLGSRLHYAEENRYIAYAQWPSEEVYERDHAWTSSGLKDRQAMHETLIGGKATVLAKMTVQEDLTAGKPFVLPGDTVD